MLRMQSMSSCGLWMWLGILAHSSHAYLAPFPMRFRSGVGRLRCTADSAEICSKVDELVQVAKSRTPSQWLSPSRYETVDDYSALQRLPLPFFELANVGIRGRWSVSGDNFVLKPIPGTKPLGVIHFIGGAFVGSAPHIAYRYMLDELADEGYIVVATPYKLSFNYIELCADIVARWKTTHSEIEAEYGQLPIIGLGHSAGSLLQVLISCLFPEIPRNTNILISYNNKPAKESIPQYEELVVPFAKTVTERGQAQLALKGLIESVAEQAESFAYDLARSPFAPALLGAEVLPLARQTVPAVAQVADLLETIGARGAVEFVPPPAEVAAVVGERYAVGRTLLVRFDDDSLDETDPLFVLLDARRRRLAAAAAAAAAAGVEPASAAAAGGASAAGGLAVSRVVLEGSHVTPLAQDMPSTPLDSLDPLLDLRRAARSLVLAPAQKLLAATTAFLREGR